MAKNKRKKISKLYNRNDKFSDKLLTILFLPLKIFLYYFCIQFVLRLVFKFKHKVTFSKGGYKIPDAPFLLLGNHVTNWDGVYLNTYLKKFIYFLMHDEIFKYKTSKIIAYNVLGQIKRGNNKNDIAGLRKLTDIRDAGKCIGIFPEGDISYIGKSLHIDKSIAKLAKILNMPIVLTRIDGATFQRPRWSFKIRRLPIKINITDVIPKQELSSITNQQLYDRIINGISYNDTEYQQKVKNIIKCKKPAENLEHVLFLCPDCGSNGKLISNVDRFYCDVCGYEIKYKNDAQFELVSGKNKINNIIEWANYQNQNVIHTIIDSVKNGYELIELEQVYYYKVKDGDFFYKYQDIGTISLNHCRLKFTSNDKTRQEIYPIDGLNELYIQFKGTVEILVGEYRYRFTSSIKQHYGYRFECFINSIKKNKDKIESVLNDCAKLSYTPEQAPQPVAIKGMPKGAEGNKDSQQKDCENEDLDFNFC